MKRHALIAALAALSVPATAAGPGTLDVTVTGIKNTRGTLLTCIYKDKTGFPTCQKSPTAIKQKSAITGGTMRVRFTGLIPGAYAVSVHHDEDGDGKLKTNFIGMPKEGVGVSNNPGGMPSYGKSMVNIGAGSAISVVMRYL
jgi:uncharacterized protein (DUF2141 family)